MCTYILLVYNNKENNMAKVKTFLLSFLIAALSIVFIAGCSTDTSSSNLGGEVAVVQIMAVGKQNQM